MSMLYITPIGISLGELMKTCTKCKETKEKDQFCRNKKTKDKLDSWCKKCKSKEAHNWIKNNREQFNKRCRESGQHKKQSKKDQRLIYKYGITAQDYEDMLKNQGGVCAICQEFKLYGKQQRMHVDHCHETNKVRGILCQGCNLAIGKFKDNVERMERAINYIKNEGII